MSTMTDGIHLALAQEIEFILIEEPVTVGFGLKQLPANHSIIEMLKHSMHAMNFRPFVTRLAGEGIGIMGLSDIEQIE